MRTLGNRDNSEVGVVLHTTFVRQQGRSTRHHTPGCLIPHLPLRAPRARTAGDGGGVTACWASSGTALDPTPVRGLGGERTCNEPAQGGTGAAASFARSLHTLPRVPARLSSGASSALTAPLSLSFAPLCCSSPLWDAGGRPSRDHPTKSHEDENLGMIVTLGLRP